MPATNPGDGLSGDSGALREAALQTSASILALQRRAQQEQAQTVALLTAVLGSMSDGLVAVDNCGAITAINPQAVALLALPPALVARARWAEVQAHLAQQACQPAAALPASALVPPTGPGALDEIAMADGRVLECQHRAQQIDGEALGTVLVLRDVTARKAAARELQQAQADTTRRLRETEASRRVLLSALEDQQQAEAALRRALADQAALLKEVHHRVKNNLQIMHSLLRLEAGRSASAETQTVLRDMRGRIQSMALLHESLYRSGSFAGVDLGDYLRQVATQAFRALHARAGAVRLQLDLASIRLPLDQALPCGLLVNELIGNSLKHGFADGRSGELRVALQVLDDGATLLLQVSDDGVGLPPDFAARQGQSLGLQLVADLAEQLDGQLAIGPAPAAQFSLRFRPAGLLPGTGPV